MYIIGEKLLSLKGLYQIRNYIGAYWFESKDLTKLEKTFKAYSTPQNIDDIQSIYGFLSLCFSGAVEFQSTPPMWVVTAKYNKCIFI